MSEPETGIPSDAVISRSLRDTVIALYKSGRTDDLTVKRIRARAEEALGLPTDYLKTDDVWKQKSHGLIHEAVEKYCGDASEPEQTKPKAKAKRAPTKAPESPRRVKRKAPPAEPKKKRVKAVVSSDEESDVAPPKDASDDILSDVADEPPKKPARRPRKVVQEDSDEDMELEPDATSTAKAAKTFDSDEEDAPNVNMKENASDSEMSSLIDDEPPARKKRQKQTPSEKRKKEPKSKVKAAKPKARAPKAKATEDEDPDQAEIKRLQSWLVKCGIRKVWGKELARCDTSKEKIKHLKALLSDAGMTGKFSVEKAARIKEEREMAAELEAITAGEARWGKVEDTGGRPRRAAAARAITKAPVIEGDDDNDDEHEAGDDDDNDDDSEDDNHEDDASEDPKGDDDDEDSE